MKKVITKLGFLGLAFSAMPLQACWEPSWVFGLSTGYAETKQTLAIQMVYTRFPQFPLNGIFQEHTDTGYLLGGLAGYQVENDGWILGGELSVDWQNEVRSYAFAFSDVGNVIGWQGIGNNNRVPSVTLSARVAYEIAPYFTPYMRLGLTGKKDDLDLSVSINPLLGQTVVNLENAAWQALFLAGFGAEFPLPIWTCPALRLEYNYQCYLSANGLSASGSAIDNIVNPAFSVHTHPRTQIGKLSLVWNIAS